MAKEQPTSTSDDPHLADHSKRQENAASHSGYAPPVEEERRIAGDGRAYTFREFLAHYGEEWGKSKWSAAQNTPPPAPPLQAGVQAAAVNTLLTPRTAEELRTSTRIAGTGKKAMRAFLIGSS